MMFYLLNKDNSIIKYDEKSFEGALELDCNPKVDYDGKFKPAIYCNETKLARLKDYMLELATLEKWFNSYFDKQFIQSLWQDDFKPSKDPITNEVYENIAQLKCVAQTNRNRVKELRKLIKSI